MKSIILICLLSTTYFLIADLKNNILQPVSGSPFFTEGEQPTPVSYSPNGKFIAVANFASANITMFNAFTFQIIGVFSLSGGAAQSQSLAFHPSGEFVATGNRTGNSISVFSVADDGNLIELASSPFATGVGGDPDAIAYSPNGDFLASANRLDNTITMFRVNKLTGDLTKIGDFSTGASDAIAISFSPDNRFIAVANRLTNNISVFSVDLETGTSTLLADSPFATGGIDPRSIDYSPDGSFLGATNFGGTNQISMFSVDKNGSLTLLTLTPSGDGPRWLEFHPKEPFLFVLNNGVGDGIRVFRFLSDGQLQLLEFESSASTTDNPQVLSIHPLGGFVAFSNMNIDALSILTINQGFSPYISALFNKYSPVCNS